jgi:hypothetical protein
VANSIKASYRIVRTRLRAVSRDIRAIVQKVLASSIG